MKIETNLDGLFYPVDTLIEEFLKVQMSTVSRKEAGFIIPFALNPFSAATMLANYVTEAKLTPYIMLVHNDDIHYGKFRHEHVSLYDDGYPSEDDKICICLYGYDPYRKKNDNEDIYTTYGKNLSSTGPYNENETDEEREARTEREDLEKESEIIKHGQILVSSAFRFHSENLNEKFKAYFTGTNKKKSICKLWKEFSENDDLTEEEIMELNCYAFRHIAVLWKTYARTHVSDTEFFIKLATHQSMFRPAIDFTTPEAFEKYDKTGEIDNEHAYIIS